MRWIFLLASTFLCIACASPKRVALADGEMIFSGIVEEVDTGCYADGVCFMTVDGQKVVFGLGWSRSEWGEVEPVEPIMDYVGKRVLVYCKRHEDDCRLEGSADYYIRPSR